MGYSFGKAVMNYIYLIIVLWITNALAAESETPPPDAAKLYSEHCAQCHHPQRLGSIAPALLPENLGRLPKTEAATVITKGRVATQMPAFGEKLSPEEIQALVAYVYTPLATPLNFSHEDLLATHKVHLRLADLPAKPVHQADPLNLFFVVELGDHHATILDGDKLEAIHRFPTPFALHGGPKYSPTGRFVYYASRDGWIGMFDMYSLQVVAEIRAGINTRNLAISDDGKYVIVANYLPHNLVILSGEDLSPVHTIQVQNDLGKTSRVSGVYSAPPRHSFIVALKDIPEVWEIPYSDKAEALPVYTGTMHDYRQDSGEKPLIDTQKFPIRRIKLDNYLDDFVFDQNYLHLIGTARDGNQAQVVNLVVGRKIAEIPLTGLPHLGSGITWEYQGKTVLATPNLKEGSVSIIDMQSWKTIKRIETLGAGFFMRSHENSPYAWTDVFMGKQKDSVQIIDKRSLEIVKTLRPMPNKTAAHVEFDRYGKYVLLSIWDMDGAIIVYDAKTLEEVKRIPMKKPSGKYNVYNKIHFSSGTSH